MAVFQFGSGSLYATNTDVANSTPHLFGTLQDVNLDISFTLKELYGRKQFPDDIARGKGKITGKASAANINGSLFNDLFFGQTLTTGSQVLVVNDESGNVGVTPFTVTVANAAAFREDLGVKFHTTGAPLTKVASAPAVGQYSVNVATGVYSFNSGDTNKLVDISYDYTAGGTQGVKLVVANQFMGAAPHFKAVLNTVYNGQQCNILLNNCISSKLTFVTKSEDYVIPELDFSAFADASGNILELDFPF